MKGVRNNIWQQGEQLKNRETNMKATKNMNHQHSKHNDMRQHETHAEENTTDIDHNKRLGTKPGTRAIISALRAIETIARTIMVHKSNHFNSACDKRQNLSRRHGLPLLSDAERSGPRNARELSLPAQQIQQASLPLQPQTASSALVFTFTYTFFPHFRLHLGFT